MMMGALQPLHLALIAVVALLVFGPRKLPELARGIGDAIKELKHSLHGEPEAPQVAAALDSSGSAPRATGPASE